MESKPVIYLIPGLAADESIFRYMKLPGYEVRCLEWVDPLDGEKIVDYARRFCGKIDTSRPVVLLGVSMGGIMAVEMAQFCNPEKIFLVSSLRNKKELPWYLKVFIAAPLYKVIPFSFFKRGMKTVRRMAGNFQRAEMMMVSSMLDKASPKFFKWALHEVLHWEQKGILTEIIQIHGTSDKLFPKVFIRNAHHHIKGGNHFMIVSKGKEIAGIILQYLNGNVTRETIKGEAA